MPKECLDVECRNCDYHVVKGDKVNCNYRNRLKMAKSGVMDFLEESEEDEE